MKNWKRRIALWLILAFAIMQVLPSNRPENKEPTETDLIHVEQAGEEVVIILKKACYDCHSEESAHPWYSSFAPVSWWINDHIEDGREHFNFSNWGNYSPKKKAHKAEEGVEEIEEGEMPLWSYQIGHSSARLNNEEQKILMDWFASLEQKYSQD